MKRKTRFLISLFLILFLTGCQSAWQQRIPDTEIVYQVGGYQASALGYTNADVSEISTITLDESTFGKFQKPVWSQNGIYLFGLSGIPNNTIGYPAYWNVKDGKFKVCNHNQPSFSEIEDGGDPKNVAQALISNVNTIVRMDLETCQSTIIVKYDIGKYNIEGFSYFPISKELLYGLITNPSENPSFNIIELNLRTGDSIVLGNGVNPSWSPDGSKIAYVWTEGIYIMERDGSNPRLIQKENFYNPSQYRPFGFYTPIPRWSPNGDWILYHGCNQYDCNGNYSVYKVSSSGGQSELIVTNGLNATWKP